MADLADLSTEAAERHLAAALATVPAPQPIHAAPNCLACDEPLTGTPRRWCDAECRDHYEKSKRLAPPKARPDSELVLQHRYVGIRGGL